MLEENQQIALQFTIIKWNTYTKYYNSIQQSTNDTLRCFRNMIQINTVKNKTTYTHIAYTDFKIICIQEKKYY